MKKIKYMLLLLLFIPFIVLAKSDVEIKSVTLLEKSDYVEELENATYNDLKLDFKLKFVTLNDYAKYKVIIKNNTDKDYEIDNQTTFNEGNFIKYEFNIDNDSKILKANEELNIYVNISYIKEVESSNFVNGKYVDSNTVSLELSNFNNIDDKENIKFIVNPNTDTGYIIAILLVLLLSILVIILIKNRKAKRYIAILILLLIPLYVYAIEKIKLDVETYVEIVKNNKFTVVLFTHPADVLDGELLEFEYEEGMTFNDYFNSSYFENLDENYKNGLKYSFDDNNFSYFKNGFKTCVSDLITQKENNEITIEDFDNGYNNCVNLYVVIQVDKDEKINNKNKGSYAIYVVEDLNIETPMETLN